jgi:addiction module HigA family antidote
MVNSVLPAIHPGEILRDLYLEPLDMTPYALAKKLNVPRTRIERIVAEKVGITPDTALRLARFFKTSPELWMNMQTSYDLKTQAQALKAELATIEEYALAS